MRNAYLFVGKPKLFNFSTKNGSLVFTSSFQDMTFLNGVFINNNLKIFVSQEVRENWVGLPILAFLIFSDSPARAENLEDITHYAQTIAALLHRYTQLGLVFEHKDTYLYPNIVDTWNLEEMEIQFGKNDNIDGIYWDDPSVETYEEDGEKLKELTMKNVNADLFFSLGSENFLTQSHSIHITLVGNEIGMDASIIRQNKSVIEKMKKFGFPEIDDTFIYLLKLFNRAVSTEDIFTGYLLLYQMVEVVMKTVEATKINPDIIENVEKILSSDSKSIPYSNRVKGALSSINAETSKELFLKGLINFTSKEFVEALDKVPFSDWRIMRGKLVHPKKMAKMTDETFVSIYNSLRSFWDDAISYSYGDVALIDVE